MARLSLKLAGYPWDHLTPLLTGEVVPDGIDLQYDVHHGLGWLPTRRHTLAARRRSAGS